MRKPPADGQVQRLKRALLRVTRVSSVISTGYSKSDGLDISNMDVAGLARIKESWHLQFYLEKHTKIPGRNSDHKWLCRCLNVNCLIQIYHQEKHI